jgi:hypothetical protein
MTDLAATSLDYRRALLAVRDSKTTKSALWDTGVKMLLAQYRESGHAISVAQLAASARSTSDNTARLHYSAFAALVARELGYEPPASAMKPMWWLAIATSPTGDNTKGATEFTMRPELAEAIELMGWVKTG